ncbi:MAG: hypothetical protein HOQ12_09500 [Gemmatimonadaceae bacterium]|nr:hypothetical protein [Gemmatimonadaceae bacterium]
MCAISRTAVPSTSIDAGRAPIASERVTSRSAASAIAAIIPARHRRRSALTSLVASIIGHGESSASRSATIPAAVATRTTSSSSARRRPRRARRWPTTSAKVNASTGLTPAISVQSPTLGKTGTFPGTTYATMACVCATAPAAVAIAIPM